MSNRPQSGRTADVRVAEVLKSYRDHVTSAAPDDWHIVKQRLSDWHSPRNAAASRRTAPSRHAVAAAVVCVAAVVVARAYSPMGREAQAPSPAPGPVVALTGRNQPDADEGLVAKDRQAVPTNAAEATKRAGLAQKAAAAPPRIVRSSTRPEASRTLARVDREPARSTAETSDSVSPDRDVPDVETADAVSATPHGPQYVMGAIPISYSSSGSTTATLAEGQRVW